MASALEGLELTPTRSRGQSFLTDPFVADAEAALVGTAPGDPVLEVGGGLGILTRALLRRGIGPLTVIEKEPRLAGFLRYHFGDRIAVVEADALVWPTP
ncbi:MAG TPA: rRNA adenine N-6-methyltransferase family protein, partial [Thermoplasmata archaeon]|nr:rRNA adenine N-6-methyltransferase family protein [Thermoplasmata archaeon]